MEETAPFVPLGSQEEMWDDNNSEDFTEALQTDSIRFRKSLSCNRTQVVVGVIFTAMVVVIIVLIAFLATRNRAKPGKNLCLQSECVEASYEVMSAMNFSADPCDDFFNYACGGWERDNDIPETQSTWGQFSILSLKNDNVLKKLMSDPEIKEKYNNSAAVRKTFQFHEACMDKNKINREGAKPLLKVIADYNSWNLSGNWSEASWDFMTTLVDLQRNLSVSPFFSMYLSSDYYNSQANVIMVDQAGLGMTREVYFENRTDYEKIRKAYKKLMLDTVALLGAEGEDVQRQMMEIFELEKKLALVTIPVLQRRNIEEHYKKMSVRNLASFTGNVINWKDFLHRIFVKYDYQITDDTVVVVYALDYLKNMSAILEKTSTTVRANYMMWRVVQSYMPALSEDFKNVLQEYNKVRYGSKEQRPLWRQCLSATTGAFGMPLGLLFIDKKFSAQSKAMIQELIREVRSVFIENLQHLDWMDKTTKESAKDKAIAILENIGYPEYVRNITQLDNKYEGLQPTNNYFENILEKSAYLTEKNYKKVKEPVNKAEWGMNPQTVNAYYSSTKNKIVFPAGILQAPFFNKDRPRALNYGGIGAVVGHEITHGFDDNGRRFNKKGNLVKWWSNSSIDAFKEKTKCLAEQYSNYTFFGEKIKGGQTLGENIADNGGVKQAYQAYQNYKNKYGDDRLLPGLNTTNDQLFFIGFAQVWCGKFRRQAAIQQVESGVHTPGKYRVIGTLSNSKFFAKAFNCASGTTMNPHRKCAVW